ncbi:alpha/beta hydrolase [Mesorhizobium sp. 113-1-2]|uniref:alpha/beta fold hydrolase n=1 Tax=Mesorhizobium sp. 113-1-2 TaxID=2744515 RepID=UPI001927B50C|nr:alpha/beta hydrolase [Mesorhizobium sp. 113-1-2]
MKPLIAGLALAGMAFATMASAQSDKPTIVLVHGAFADASSWNGVVPILEKDGYPVVAVANPLRSVKADGDYVRSLLNTIKTPIVLVGHSYGGMVISQAADGEANVKALVYVAGFAPDKGESAGALDTKFPGALVGPDTLAQPVPLLAGGNDLYVRQDKFHEAFAPDLPEDAARLAAATQRPITDIAFGEPATASAWKTIPSWFIYGDGDTAIPPKAQAFMAERAHAKGVVVVKGASHVVMISHPDAVAKIIEDAATAAP